MCYTAYSGKAGHEISACLIQDLVLLILSVLRGVGVTCSLAWGGGSYSEVNSSLSKVCNF